MQLVPKYLLNNSVSLIANLAGEVTEYRPVYTRNINVVRGIDSTIQFNVLNADQKPVSILNTYTPKFKLFDENNSVTDQIAVDGGVADVSEEGITVLSERAEVLGSNASNKQIINEKINALNNKLKKPEFQEDEALKNEIDFLNFVLEKSN